MAVCLTFKRHSPIAHVSAAEELTEPPDALGEDGDRLSTAFSTPTPRHMHQTNNSNAALEESQHGLMASTPISHLSGPRQGNWY